MEIVEIMETTMEITIVGVAMATIIIGATLIQTLLEGILGGVINIQITKINILILRIRIKININIRILQIIIKIKMYGDLIILMIEIIIIINLLFHKISLNNNKEDNIMDQIQLNTIINQHQLGDKHKDEDQELLFSNKLEDLEHKYKIKDMVNQ